MAVSEAAGEDVRLRHRRQRRRRLGAGAPADRGARRHGLRAGGRAARPASRTSMCRPASSRCCSTRTYTWQFKTEPGEGSGGRRNSHHAGPHARRVQLDQRHDLQPRPARRFRQLGAARQSRLGLCRHAALFQAHRAADRHRRRPHSRPRGQPAGHRHRLDPSDLRGLHRPAPSAWGSRAAPTTTAATARRASAISSARSTVAGGTRPRVCSCIRPRRPVGWTCAPTRGPPRCCSRASVRRACAT